MMTSFCPSATALSRMSSMADSLALLICWTAAFSSFPRKPPVSWDRRSSRVSTFGAVTSPEASSAKLSLTRLR